MQASMACEGKKTGSVWTDEDMAHRASVGRNADPCQTASLAAHGSAAGAATGGEGGILFASPIDAAHFGAFST
jgi:hypothetical protein